ncbi:HEAT repeat domain-containing protein [Pirellulaceae bacterium SH501]
MSRIALLILFQWSIVSFAFSQTTDSSLDQVESWRSRINNNEDLLQTLAELQKQTAMIEQLIPELTKLLQDGSEPVRRLTVRCLYQAGEKASPAVASLASNLDHRDYLFRSEVMQTLKAIGPIAAPELKEALKSPSSRIRASALATLDCLVTLEADLLEQLQNDPDSRVRISVAQAWKKHGKRGVERMVALLKDPESVVATEAALSLRFHFEDPQTAVKHLNESLSRKDSSYSSALALQSFGVEAQVAIPNLIRSMPLGYPEDFHQYTGEDMVSTVLAHIGPPRLADLDSLRLLLEDANPERGAVAARMIGQLGTEAIAAAPQLESLCRSSLNEHLKVMEKASLNTDEYERQRFIHNDGFRSLCLAACSAFWRVSRDTERFAKLIEDLATQWESEIYFSDNPFAEFSEQDIPHLLRMLDSPNINLRETALDALNYHIPGETISLQVLAAMRKLDRFDIYYRQSLPKAVISNLRPQLLSWLIEDLEDNDLDLRDFARTVALQKIRSPKIETILTHGLESPDPSTRSACLAGLAAIATDDQESVRILLSNAEKDESLRRTSLVALLKLRRASELSVPFAIECLNDSDIWVRNYAISLLARIGPPARNSSQKLESLANKIATESENGGDDEARLRTVIAVARVSRDESGFMKYFAMAMSDQTDGSRRGRATILNVLKELGPDADSFMDEITALIEFASSHRISDEQTLEDGLTLLAVVGSPRSIELLKTFQVDRDWRIRSMAKKLMRMIDDDMELYYDTYIE